MGKSLFMFVHIRSHLFTWTHFSFLMQINDLKPYSTIFTSCHFPFVRLSRKSVCQLFPRPGLFWGVDRHCFGLISFSDVVRFFISTPLHFFSNPLSLILIVFSRRAKLLSEFMPIEFVRRLKVYLLRSVQSLVVLFVCICTKAQKLFHVNLWFWRISL
jgi:hypothetical protein